MNQTKQMTGILSQVNWGGPKPVLVKCLAVHNEEDWVQYNLANNYSEYDKIRVVEGAVIGRPNSTEDGHSTDRTIELIKSFPDPDSKIELYQGSRFFKSLEEQKQTFLDYAQDGEWLFVVDGDEFYLDGEIERVRRAIEINPGATEFIPTFLHFYRDFKHIKAPHPEWQPQHQRILRYQPGMRYHTHPVATDNFGKCTYFDGGYQRTRYTIPNLYIYHYGHAKGKKFHEMKKKFYKGELEKFELRDGTNASDKFDEKFVEFMEYKEDISSILAFNDKHPEIMYSHPTMSYNEPYYDNLEFKDWKDNFVYSADKLPTIALMMMGPWKQSRPFYNYVRV